MLPGFNHNIKHKGRMFHIQTEDSGVKNPHIITHLFVGGNILASKKTTYSELLDQEDYEKSVRAIMEEQHKEMLRNLVNSVYDEVVTGAVHHLNGPRPVNEIPKAPPNDVAPSRAPHEVIPRPPMQPIKAIEPEEKTGPEPLRISDERPETNIFGEDLISEKSLDEVILSYLAEDLSD